MTTSVSKWGNSLGIRIPKTVAAAVNVGDGDEVEVSVHEGAIVIRPTRQRYTIEELVADITPEKRDRETDWGRRVGREMW
jgi:antitoxin MazE